VNAIRLYGRYVGASLRSQMQYPGAFLLTSVGAFAATGIDFIAVWALFSRFRQIGGWQFGEIALFYGVIGVSFALAVNYASKNNWFAATDNVDYPKDAARIVSFEGDVRITRAAGVRLQSDTQRAPGTAVSD